MTISRADIKAALTDLEISKDELEDKREQLVVKWEMFENWLGSLDGNDGDTDVEVRERRLMDEETALDAEQAALEDEERRLINFMRSEPPS